jgi:phage replication O-like protein O
MAVIAVWGDLQTAQRTERSVMASPQKENGHVQIANELWEALCRCRIPRVARQCLDAILRKTYGYNKKMDYISIGQISELTGIPRPKVSRALNQLATMNLIIKDTTKYINFLGINKNYDTWEVFPNTGTENGSGVPENGNSSVPKNGNESVPKNGTHKRQKTIKDNIYNNSQIVDDRKHELQLIVEHNYPQISKMGQQFTYDQCEKLYLEYDLQDQIIPILDAMENWKKLLKQNNSVYLTALNWIRNNGRGKK